MTDPVMLTVAAVSRETDDAVTLVFDDPDELIGGRSGQHVVLHVEIDGVAQRRVFSLSSSPELGQAPAITVKRLVGGTVSPFLVEESEVGHGMALEPADGVFMLPLDPVNRRTYYGFIAGSGVVPVLSLTRAILAIEPESNIHLAYGNRTSADVIGAAELAHLTEAHPDRLSVTSVLSGDGRRIDHLFVNDFLMGHPPRSMDVRYLVCGPPGMRDGVVARLASLGIMDEHVLVEYYLPPSRGDAPDPYDGAQVVDRASGGRAAVPAGDTVLDGLVGAGAGVVWACQSGVCGTCKARLVSGDVDPGHPFVLTDEEQSAGMILTCIARPLSAEVVVEVE